MSEFGFLYMNDVRPKIKRWREERTATPQPRISDAGGVCKNLL
jgi:hypothetical protein